MKETEKNIDIDRVLDVTLSNKKFYQRLLEFGFDISDVWQRWWTRPKPRREIRLDDFYRNNQGIESMTAARWWQKYDPQRFKNLRDTINNLSSVPQSAILTDQEKDEIDIIKKRICNKYEYDRDLLVRKMYKEAKEKSPDTQAQCDTEVLLPLFNYIWGITDNINAGGFLDAEGRGEYYHRTDVIELLACILQATALAQLWTLTSLLNEDREKSFKQALEIWKGSKRKRERGSKPPYDAKYVHDRVYPP